MKTKVASANLIVTSKCSRAIPAQNIHRRDFIIQSTLDGSVRRIEYHPAMQVDDAIVEVDAIIIDSDSGRHVIDFIEARPEFDPIGENLMHLGFCEGCSGIMYVTGEDIRKEPRFSASREVWRHHAIRIHTDDRAQIEFALECEGPQPLGSLYRLVDTSRDVSQIVFSMACCGDVEIDLDGQLGLRTIVRPGKRSASRLAYGT
jgi:hypothetical protein